jgi:hypothetical protein
MTFEGIPACAGSARARLDRERLLHLPSDGGPKPGWRNWIVMILLDAYDPVAKGAFEGAAAHSDAYVDDPRNGLVVNFVDGQGRCQMRTVNGADLT